jgi:fructosamine-3-kinase
MWTDIAAQISQATGKDFEIKNRRSVGGGCINQSYALIGSADTYFVKLNQASQLQMFEAEALGLKEMYETKTIRIPKPICWGIAADFAFIVLEWLELGGRASADIAEQMGRQLAAMHQAKPPQGSNGKFGWHHNNTIGSTPQINDWREDWAEFFTEYRLRYQFQLAQRRGGTFPGQDKLLAIAPQLIDRQPQPSLVHGDLWGGNASVTTEGEPVLLDPATYVGDREVDLAMTELFGGFSTPFYRGYNEAWPLDEGYKRRKPLYNLYHILNHFNIFGGGYGSQASHTIDRILASV